MDGCGKKAHCQTQYKLSFMSHLGGFKGYLMLSSLGISRGRKAHITLKTPISFNQPLMREIFLMGHKISHS